MSMYQQIMKKIAQRQSLTYGIYNEGDYYEEQDGYKILHCQECHKAKQQIMFISLVPYEETLKAEEEYAIKHPNLSADEVHKAIMNIMPQSERRKDLGLVGVPCKCQRDYISGRTKQEKSDERRRTIKENAEKCFISNVLRKDTFSVYKENKFIKAAKKYAKQWAEMKKQGKGLILCGQAGAGKSVAAVCLANELLDREVSVLFKVQQEIIYEFQRDISQRKSYLDSLVYCGLLIIDDLNLSLISTDSSKEILFYIINERIITGKPIIVTTNHRSSAFLDAEMNSDKRIFERLGNACYIVEDNKHNYRRNRNDNE